MLQIRIISIRIRIQDAKKFVTDPHSDSDPDWTLIQIWIQTKTVRIRVQAKKDSKPISINNHLNEVITNKVCNGFCWIQPNFWYGSESREMIRIRRIRIRNRDRLYSRLAGAGSVRKLFENLYLAGPGAKAGVANKTERVCSAIPGTGTRTA